ncbi:MAG: hypothetical protein JNK29_05735 [Anaerolineales bacterium]|nr:hypothetical protein [Anaerolineales bacterium]
MRDAGPRLAGAVCLWSLAAVLLAACAAPATPTPIVVVVTSAPPTPTPLPTLTAVPSPAPGGLFVDARQDLGPISPLVYGSNYGPWLFVPLQMEPAAIDARLTVLRFPGGNWGDQNDLDEWQIDQYLAFCRKIGAAPFIHVRLRDGTAARAADLVRLVNVTKGAGVRYWAIGNEPNYYEADTASYTTRWREWARAMRAVDPSIQLIGPETDRFRVDPAVRPKDTAGRDWMAEFLKANGDLVDIVAFHLYPFPAGRSAPPPSIADLRADAPAWDDIIRALRQLIREQTGRDLPVAVTEVNSSWAANSGGEGTLDSHYNAIWWGDVLGRLIRQGVHLVTQFDLIGEYGLMGKYEVYPIYRVYQLYQRFGSERVLATSADPDLSVYAATRPDGALTLMIVNLASAPAQTTLTLAGGPAPAAAETWRFDAEHPAVQVEATPLAAQTDLTFPAESITLLILPAP